MTVGIVGLGLIGGSMAKSIKARTAHTVFGCDLDQETMMMARMCGAIDAPLTAKNLKECDLVLVAIRPAAAVKWVKEHAEGIRRDAILVDLCGVKRAVVRELAPVAEQYGFAYIGGHPMAAGLSLDKENDEKFKRRLNDQCTLSEEELTEKVVIDMELPFAAITEQFIEELEYMEPFGKGNTKPVFAARGVVMQHVKIIGKNKNVAKATAIDAAGNRMEAICFHDAQEFAERCERNNGKMSITFYPGINEFRGERQIQIVITHYR